jgi:hypothetical protein
MISGEVQEQEEEEEEMGQTDSTTGRYFIGTRAISTDTGQDSTDRNIKVLC